MSDYYLLSDNLIEFFIQSYNIGFVIISPTLCVIGFILNLLSFIVFVCLKEKIFFYLAMKSLAEALLLMTGAISPYMTCINCNLENTYLIALITLIVAKFAKGPLYTLITILEIEIAFNRYNLINSHTTKTLIEMKDKIKGFVFTLISILLFVPYLFAFEINKNKMYEYKMEKSKFGSSEFFYYFYTCISFENILSVLILLPLNIIIIIKFKKFIQQKQEQISTTPRMRQDNVKIETRFTRLMILISFLFILSRLAEASVSLVIIYNQHINALDYYDFILTLLNVYVYANTFLIFSLNFFIFYFLNKTFRLKFKEIFKCCFKN